LNYADTGFLKRIVILRGSLEKLTNGKLFVVPTGIEPVSKV
jgi:hypothetical protein